QIERANIPHLAAVDFQRRGHSAVNDHLIELRRTDPDVHRSLIAREATTRHRSNIGEGAGHCGSSLVVNSSRLSPSGPSTGFRSLRYTRTATLRWIAASSFVSATTGWPCKSQIRPVAS